MMKLSFSIALSQIAMITTYPKKCSHQFLQIILQSPLKINSFWKWRMNRFIILFVLYVIAQAKPLSCPADVITIPYDSQKPHFIQKTHSILVDIPAKMFKGLTHPNFQFLDQMHLDKKI